MKSIYLDVCTMCRPFDDQSLMRIRLETDAFYLILRAVQNQIYKMSISPVHYKEIGSIGDDYERMELTVLLEKYGKRQRFQMDKIRKRAEDLFAIKLGVADAAHLAFAEAYSDYFVTCDDKLLKKYRKLSCNLSVLNPVEFCLKENLK